jgi:SAM-dependent methyltransferase
VTTIRTQQGAAETLPFADGTFNWAVSRMSAHHWRDVPAALKEAHRVLKPGGRLRFIDIAGIDDPLYDTHIQAIELLRDASHIRDYRADEWIAMLDAAGFDAQVTERWRIPLEFESWVTRMRTPAERVTAIRSMWKSAPDDVRQYFGVKDDCSFELDAMMIEAKRRD